MKTIYKATSGDAWQPSWILELNDHETMFILTLNYSGSPNKDNWGEYIIHACRWNRDRAIEQAVSIATAIRSMGVEDYLTTNSYYAVE